MNKPHPGFNHPSVAICYACTDSDTCWYLVSEVQGYCDSLFEQVREAFQKNFDEGKDIGASLAMTVNGETVVDLWGGHANPDRSAPWERDTIVNVYSSTKTMMALCTLMLADRDVLDLTAPVADYWPEFAQNGKQGVLVKHFLSHMAGLSGLDESASGEALYDWNRIVSLLEAQTPWWEPGSASGYHALTQGYLVGELFRRVTDTSLGHFFRDEVATPLEVDFHIGLPPECDARVAELLPPEDMGDAPPPPPGSIAARTFASPVIRAQDSRTSGWRRAEIAAANGHGNARSIARALSAIACGGSLGGVELLSEAGCRRIFEVQSDGLDLVLGVPVRWGMGFGLNSELMPISPNPNSCYWGGWGGSLAIIDCDARVSVGYAMNRMIASLIDQTRTTQALRLFYQAL